MHQHRRRDRAISRLVLTGAVLVALISARPNAGGWNDGSRLATVESLVDFRTLAIDSSIFITVPPDRSPYPAEDVLLSNGTQDKLFIDGHFYSDKSPVPALLLAAVYQVLQWCFGLVAREQPALFCFLMNLAVSGCAYVAAVVCVQRLARLTQLSTRHELLLTGSFALSTLAVVYARHVNNHILLLAIAAALMLALARLSRTGSCWTIARIGGLAGLGYTMDLGAGPPLILCTLALIAWRCRCWRALAVCSFSIAPWLLLHHAFNFAVGGTLQPANAVAEYFNWPGSPFSVENLTGSWQHASLLHFLGYAFTLLFGKQGFIGHNLSLFLAIPTVLILLWRRNSATPELLFGLGWCISTWLLYAATSRNHSGVCCSIRWFVPLLAPLYFALAVLLKARPAFAGDLLLLSVGGLVLSALAWAYGPWIPHMVPGYWFILGGTLLCWAAWRLLQGGIGGGVELAMPGHEKRKAA